jgi:hypothetical protein
MIVVDGCFFRRADAPLAHTCTSTHRHKEPSSMPFAPVWLVWALLLFGGFLFGAPNAERTRRMPVVTRIGSSVALVIAAWLSLALLPHPLSPWIALGMTLGCIGDLFMAGLLPVRNHVLGGIASFSLGHIAYIVGLVSVPNMAFPWLTLALLLIIGAAAWYMVVFRPAKARSSLHKAALPYALLLSATTGIALGLALQLPMFIPLAAGAALFLLSDLILAARLFNNLTFRLIDDVIWLTYGPGQMLIVFTLILGRG